tara:strand:+ start:32293 stop:32616 length:324 start_codon:yes stop_codon:yes gene_type:complete
MPVVKKATLSPNKVSKKRVVDLSVRSVREPSAIREMGDVKFGTLDATKDNLIVSYDSTSDKFILVTADDILSTSVDDSDLPDDFVEQIETDVDLGDISITNFDGGNF